MTCSSQVSLKVPHIRTPVGVCGGVDFCIGDAHGHFLPGVEEQKAIKSFSKWAFLMASSSNSSTASEELLFPIASTESFNHTTPWFPEKTRLISCCYQHPRKLPSPLNFSSTIVTNLFVTLFHSHVDAHIQPRNF